jgi:glycosyltransferase 2 family protein
VLKGPAPTVKRAINLTLSLAVTGVSFWWTFKGTDFDTIWASVKTANYLLLVPYLALLTVVHVCRTLRWGNLLSGLEKVPFRKLNEAASIGFMMLIILPFRLGEFARPFLIAQRSNIRRSPAMATVVFERLVDGIFIALMLRGLLFFIPVDNDEIRRINWGANLMFAVFGGGFLFLLFARWQHDRAVKLVRTVAGVVSPGLGEKVATMVDGFVGATRQLPNAANLVSFFVLTGIYWALNGYGMSLLSQAFDCSGDTSGLCVPMSLTLFQGYVVLAVLVVGLMIPAAPGSAGTFQAFIVLGLSVFIPKEALNSSGVAYANVIWVVQLSQQILFGFVLMLLSHQSFSDVAGKLNAEQQAAPTAKAA